MFRSAIAFVLGALVVAGTGFVWLRAADGCLARCGEGTRCEASHCVAAAPATPPPAVPDKILKTHRTGVAPGLKHMVILRPGDDRPVALGDSLGRPEHIDMTKPGLDGAELDQAEIDGAFGNIREGISSCITKTIGDLPLTSGTVDVGMRIEKTGSVSRVRVEAPKILQDEGLPACIRPLVVSLTFPKSGGATVVNYPFVIK